METQIMKTKVTIIILAELVKKQSKMGVYLVIRSTCTDIGEKKTSLVRKMLNFVKEEKDVHLPGLVYNINIRFKFDWDPEQDVDHMASNDAPYCDVYNVSIDLGSTLISTYSSSATASGGEAPPPQDFFKCTDATTYATETITCTTILNYT
jgi:hypothetical protein